MTNFPATIDSFQNPGAATTMDAAGFEHDAQHANANDALAALQSKVGINGSTDPNSLDYKVSQMVALLLAPNLGMAKRRGEAGGERRPGAAGDLGQHEAAIFPPDTGQRKAWDWRTTMKLRMRNSEFGMLIVLAMLAGVEVRASWLPNPPVQVTHGVTVNASGVLQGADTNLFSRNLPALSNAVSLVLSAQPGGGALTNNDSRLITLKSNLVVNGKGIFTGGTAAGLNSFSVNGTASGNNSVAFHQGVTLGDDSFAAPWGHAGGLSSFAGPSSVAYGTLSAAFGGGHALADNSFVAAGGSVESTGTNSITFGYASSTSGTNSSTFGVWANNRNNNTFLIHGQTLVFDAGASGDGTPTDQLRHDVGQYECVCLAQRRGNDCGGGGRRRVVGHHHAVHEIHVHRRHARVRQSLQRIARRFVCVLGDGRICAAIFRLDDWWSHTLGQVWKHNHRCGRRNHRELRECWLGRIFGFSRQAISPGKLEPVTVVYDEQRSESRIYVERRLWQHHVSVRIRRASEQQC
jgi:hypothetical protein